MDTINKPDIPPFELYKNLYFVGSRRVSVHVIKTECGHVLIDTGYPDMVDCIISNMKKLGLNPVDICAIFHTHGHVDHYGCTRELKAISNAKTYISRIDNDIVNGTYDLSCAKEEGYSRIEPFNCDVLMEDGDIFTFGDTTIRCKLTPGHTDGTMSFFINLSDGDENIIAAMHGGLGLGSMSREFLEEYGLPFTCRDKFREGLDELMNEHVDCVLGNHPYQNDTEGKYNRLMSGEKMIVDGNEWQRVLTAAKESLDRLIENEKQPL